jgi:DNA polymerase-4
LFGPAKAIAQEIRNRLRVETGVMVSIGLGPNGGVARLAAATAQPGEVVEVRGEEAAEFVGKLPIFALPGVTPERIEQLGRLGIRHARDLAKLPEEAVERALGEWGRRLREVARGDPDEGALPLTQAGSPPYGRRAGLRHRTEGYGALAASHQSSEEEERRDSSPVFGGLRMTIEEEDDAVAGEAELHPPTDDRERIRAGLRLAAEQVTRLLRARGLVGRQIALDLVFRDLRVVGARRTLRHSTRSNEVVFHAARDLLDRAKLSTRLVRRVRVRVARLAIGPQGGQLALPLLEREARRERLAEMVERVRDRFGEEAVRRASVIELVRQ